MAVWISSYIGTCWGWNVGQHYVSCSFSYTDYNEIYERHVTYRFKLIEAKNKCLCTFNILVQNIIIFIIYVKKFYSWEQLTILTLACKSVDSLNCSLFSHVKDCLLQLPNNCLHKRNEIKHTKICICYLLYDWSLFKWCNSMVNSAVTETRWGGCIFCTDKLLNKQPCGRWH